MTPLVGVFLVCGAFYAGAQTIGKRRSRQKALWLKPPDGQAQRASFRFSTRVYIVRCWEEQAQRDDQRVTRYSLEVPTDGLRCGYTSAEALLQALSMQLTSTHEA